MNSKEITFEKLGYVEFIQRFKRIWKQGQHVALIGPTGCGKTTLAHDIELMREYVAVVATKQKDESLDCYKSFSRISQWPPDYHEKLVLFWKKPKVLGDFRVQREAIYAVLNDVYKVGGWTIYFDDLFYVSDTLRLKDAIRMFYTQVRSNNVSIVASMQRPFWNPVEALSQSTYACLFATHDLRDIKRVSECFSIPFHELQTGILQLKEYQFLFIQTGRIPIIVEKRS